MVQLDFCDTIKSATRKHISKTEMRAKKKQIKNSGQSRKKGSPKYCTPKNAGREKKSAPIFSDLSVIRELTLGPVFVCALPVWTK